MLDAIKTEWLKLRSYKIGLICSLISLSVPVLLLFKELFISPAITDFNNWLLTSYSMVTIVFPVMSSFMITFLVQQEYESKTIINLLTSSITRNTFIIGKLLIWLLWFSCISVLLILLVIFGYQILFSEIFSWSEVRSIIVLLGKNFIASFIANVPLLWLAIKQRTLFYPTVMLGLLLMALQLSGTQISNDLLWLGSLIPWTAVSIINQIPCSSFYFWECGFSILLSGFLGIYFAIYALKKQDL